MRLSIFFVLTMISCSPGLYSSTPFSGLTTLPEEQGVNLSWNEARTKGVSYAIERRLFGAAVYAQIGRVSGVEYLDSSIVQHGVYEYRIVAEDINGRARAHSESATVDTNGVLLLCQNINLDEPTSRFLEPELTLSGVRWAKTIPAFIGFDLNGFLRLYDLMADGSSQLFAGTGSEFLDWSPNDTQFALGGFGNFKIISKASFSQQTTLDTIVGLVSAGAWDPLDELIAVGGSLLEVLQLTDGEPFLQSSRHEDDVSALIWHPEGQSLISGDEGGLLLEWDRQTKSVVSEFQPTSAGIKDLFWVDGSPVLAVVTDDGQTVLWDTLEQTEVVTVTKGALNPDGQLIAQLEPGNIIGLFSADCGNRISELRVTDVGAVSAVRWSGAGRYLLVSGSGTQVFEISTDS